MYVIVADFTIDAERVLGFREAILSNARQSLAQEPGCRQFDVCTDPERPDRIYLYEVYDDEAAFKAHLESAHFHAFDSTVKDWVRAREVTALHRLFPSG